MTNNQDKLNPEAIARQVDELFVEYDAKTLGYLDIAVIGKVSSGKSSFLNAFFSCSKNEPKFTVGATSGTTINVNSQNLGEHIRIIDTPGLGDIKKENVEITNAFINKNIDIGIMIIEGSVTQSGLENYELLKKSTSNIFVVMNKIDTVSKENLADIKTQWRSALMLDPNTEIYELSCRGYDLKDKIVDPITGEEKEIPVDEYGVPKTIRGIKKLQEDIFFVCFKIGKVAFIAKQVAQKQVAAMGIIAAACAASVGSILLPGSIAFILATQTTAISSLGFLYRGNFPSKAEVAEILKIFTTTNAQTVGALAYGIFVSFMPPTGVFDIGGIIIVVSYMATTLLIVNFFFSKGLEIKKTVGLNHEFERINKSLRKSVATADIREIANINFWTKLLSQVNITIEN